MNIIDYIGKFHPLAVHLPIGILSLFVVLGIFISREQLEQHKPIVRMLLLLSALSATMSTLSGYLLANSGSYTGDLVTGHQVLGISLTILNWLLLVGLNYLFRCKRSIYRIAIGLTIILMVLTGHAGGSITHGADFLTPPPLSTWFSSESIEDSPITIQSSAFEAADKIFRQKCQVCHGDNKQEGELRLDAKEHLIAGGESGNLLGSAESPGLLIERILLPEDHEEHMPPTERKQLTRLEIEFLSWWIGNGADFEKSLAELSFPEFLQPLLAPEDEGSTNTLVPEQEVKEADARALQALNNLDVIVLPIGAAQNYLSASFVNVLPANLERSLQALNGIREQLVWLNLDYQELDSSAWSLIGDFSGLRKLSLKDTNLDDRSIVQLDQLDQLRYLNLVGADVSGKGLAALNDLSNLESLFLYQTNVSPADHEAVSNLFPEVKIDFGNYIVPVLASDTTVYSLKDLQ